MRGRISFEDGIGWGRFGIGRIGGSLLITSALVLQSQSIRCFPEIVRILLAFVLIELSQPFAINEVFENATVRSGKLVNILFCRM